MSQGARQHDRNTRHHIDFRNDTRATIWAKAAVNGFAGVTYIIVGTEIALNLHGLTRERHEGLERRTSVALTTATMADASEIWLALQGIADTATKAATGDSHDRSPHPTKVQFVMRIDSCQPATTTAVPERIGTYASSRSRASLRSGVSEP